MIRVEDLIVSIRFNAASVIAFVTIPKGREGERESESESESESE